MNKDYESLPLDEPLNGFIPGDPMEGDPNLYAVIDELKKHTAKIEDLLIDVIKCMPGYSLCGDISAEQRVYTECVALLDDRMPQRVHERVAADYELIIAKLHAEIANLKADRDSWQQQASDRVEDVLRVAGDLKKAEAQINRLKKELEWNQ